MGLDQQSYSGKLFRPRPEIVELESEQMLLVCTPWGRRQTCREGLELAKEHIILAKKDPDATSPFPKLPNVSHFTNVLRTAALIFNDLLLKIDNKKEYSTGAEIFFCLRHDHELIWVQVGQPNVLLCREGLPILPVATQFDLSMDFSLNSQDLLAPLPSQLLGIEAKPQIFMNNIQFHDHDKLILLARSWVPAGFLSLTTHDWNLVSLAKILSKESQDVPFWLGMWKL